MLLHAGARECLLAVHTKEESHEAFYFTFYEHLLFVRIMFRVHCC